MRVYVRVLGNSDLDWEQGKNYEARQFVFQ